MSSVWLTGLPGSGKTTIGKHLLSRLKKSVLLDGDEVRKWLTPDLGFSFEDRRKNVLRVGKVAQLVEQSGGIPIICLVSPIDRDRKDAITLLKSCLLIEVRGPKRKEDWGDIVYEPPLDALIIDTHEPIESCVWRILNDLRSFGVHA